MKEESNFGNHEHIKLEIEEGFSENRKVLYFGIGLVGFILATFPFMVTKIFGIFLIVLAIILYFSDKKFV